MRRTGRLLWLSSDRDARRGLRTRRAGRRAAVTAGAAVLATMAAGPASAARPTDTDATDPHTRVRTEPRTGIRTEPGTPVRTEAGMCGRTEPGRRVRRGAPASAGEPVSAASLTTPHAGWRLKDSGSDARFRGLAAVSRTTAWVAGTKGTVLRTRDGGKHWRNVSPPGAGELEFRDIEALRRAPRGGAGHRRGRGLARLPSRTTAAPPGPRRFRNPDPRAFYDCLTFFDPRHGIALSDPVDGKYRILSTGDGGRSWRVLPSDGMPAAQQGEAAFAASGQCLVSRRAPGRLVRDRRRGHRPRPAHRRPRPYLDGHRHPAPRGRPGPGRLRARLPRPHATASPSAATTAPTSRPRAPPRSARTPAPPGRRPPNPRPPTAPASPGSRTAAAPPWRSARPAADLTLDGGRTWRAFDNGSYDTVDCAPDCGCWARARRAGSHDWSRDGEAAARGGAGAGDRAHGGCRPGLTGEPGAAPCQDAPSLCGPPVPAAQADTLLPRRTHSCPGGRLPHSIRLPSRPSSTTSNSPSASESSSCR